MTQKLYRVQLTARLHKLGLPNTWIQNNLWPQWWSDELNDSASARYEVESLLAHHLGLEWSSLRDGKAELQFQEAPRARFKTHANTDLSKAHLARALGVRLGELAAQACAAAEMPLTDWSRWSAARIRETILQSGADNIGLEELLIFCWERGLPIVHAAMPDGLKKFDGMALCPVGRPVILSFCSRPSPAWHAFIVAHELGHHVLGHIGKNGEIFDSSTRTPDEKDEEESAANAFAVQLLTGEENCEFEYSGRYVSAEKLAAAVEECARTHRVNEGVILLNLFHHRKDMTKLVMRALAIVEGRQDALALYAREAERADWLALNDDDYEFVSHLATLPPALCAA